MSLYLLAGRFLHIVREPQYPELVTVLAEDRALLEGAHPGGPGAVCESFDPLFPWALHVERWALPRDFWSLRESDIVRLEHPITPEPLCWRFEGLRATAQENTVHESPVQENTVQTTAAPTNPVPANTVPASTYSEPHSAEEVTGFIPLADLEQARAQLERELESVGFYPWFEEVTTANAELPCNKRQR